MPKKIAIIGAGPGGLTAAMILAARGFDVTVFEAKDRVGGRNAELRLGEFRFDTGPTFLMLNFILREMFEEAGRNIDDYLSFTRLDPMYRLVFDDRDLRPSADPARMRAEIARAFPGEEAGLDRFLADEKARFDKLFPCIQKDYSSLGSLFSLPLLKAAPYLDIGRSVFDVLGKYFRSDKLKLAFTFQAKYLGMSPWDCPGFFTMLSYIEHAYGVYHVQGGLNAISAGMARAAEANGAKIRLSSPVRRVITEGGAARGAELRSGEVFRCDEVVINADFGHAMTTLFEKGALSKYSPEKLQAREFSCSTFMLYLGVDKVYAGLPHHTIAFAADYRANVEDIFRRKALSGDVSVYVQNASVTDPTLAPPGKSTIYILVPVPNLDGGTDWAAEKPRLRELALRLAEERAGFAGLRNHIQAERVITPADWRDEYGVYKGATFNLSHKLSQMLYLRPRNKFEELRNCWLVGGGTHPGSGLPTIYESARITSNLLCREHGVPFSEPSFLGEKREVKA